jgi:hypothetical protein
MNNFNAVFSIIFFHSGTHPADKSTFGMQERKKKEKVKLNQGYLS